MTTFATLLLAHLLGDFPLQTNKVFKLKNEGNWGLALHIAIHLLVTAVLIKTPWHFWLPLALLGTAHFITDWFKLRYPGKNQAFGFVTDQLIHFVTIFIISLWIPNLPSLLPIWVLIIAIPLAFVPAIMTFFWVWANQVRQTEVNTDSVCVEWASTELLPISQRIGQGIVLVLALMGSSLILLMA